MRIRLALAPLLILVPLLAAPTIASSPPSSVTQDGKSVVWTRYDVFLALRDDGSYHVAERQEVAFRGGPFDGGFASIPLARIEAIRGVAVSEQTAAGDQEYAFVRLSAYDGTPGTYTSTTTGTEVLIRYGFTPTTDRTRTFVLAYDVFGALRVYPDADPPNQQIWWTAIAKDVTDIAPIRVATLTIALPRPVPDRSRVVVDGPGDDTPTAHTSDGQTWTWKQSDLGPGDDLEVRLQFPPLVSADPPRWQAADDAQRQRETEIGRSTPAATPAAPVASPAPGIDQGRVDFASNLYAVGDPEAFAADRYVVVTDGSGLTRMTTFAGTGMTADSPV